MGYGMIKGLKIFSETKNGKKKWLVEFNGAVVSEPMKTRAEAVNSVKPLVDAVMAHRISTGGDVTVETKGKGEEVNE